MNKLIQISSLLLITTLSAMDEQKGLGELINEKQRIEQHKFNRDYLHYLGNENVPADLQKIADEVQKQYESKGLLPQNHPILIKAMNDEARQYLSKESSSVWNNAFNDGNHIIHLDANPDHYKKLTKPELKSLIAHEMSHISLWTSKKQYNPHYWVDHLWIGSIIGLLAVPAIVPPIMFALDKRKPLGITGLALPVIGLEALCLLGSYGLLKNAHEDRNRNVNFHCVKKLEEVICDTVAATALPNGAQAGAELYKKKLEHTGIDRSSSDHPKRTTRIWYHKLLSRIIEKKEK